MTILTAPQLVTVRDLNQHTELYIAKYEPEVIWTARINDPDITKGARVLNYDSAVGDYNNIQRGMTLYLGTTPGGDDIGRVRYRSIETGVSQITVAPDSDIQYADNQYITIKDFHEFWPVFPRNFANTGTLTLEFYKDYDISLTDENTNFDPVVIMGPAFAGFYDTFPSIYFTATGSYTVDGSTITGYSWQFPNGVTGTANVGTPGLISFVPVGPGHYTVACTVTASNGKTATGYRHIVLLDRNTGDNLPISDSSFEDLDGEWGSGYILKIKVRNRADEFKDGDLVILFAEDYYDFAKQSFGGYPGREHVVFTGYVSNVTTQYNAMNSESTLTIKGMATYMVNKEMFTLEMYDTPDTPLDWTQIQNMTINKMLNHFFRWHTTLLSMNDFIHILTAPGDYRDNWVQTSKGEISTIVGDFLKNRVMGAFSSDRQGRCFAEVDWQVIVTGSRPASVMSFQNTDWVGKPVILERIEQPIANVLVGGQAYDPPTYTGTAFLSRAPGEVQTYNGKSQNVSGLSLVDQDHVNTIAGLYYAKMNNRTPEINLELANNMRNIDVAKSELYNFTVDANSTYRFGSTAQTFRMMPRKISYKLQNFVLKATVNFETETSGPPGDTIIIPVDVPGGNPCEENPDDCDPPCTGDCDEPCINCEGDGNITYVWNTSKVGRTRNFLDTSPHWVDVSNGLAGTIIWGILDPYDPANSAYTLTTSGIYHCSNLDSSSPTWTLKQSSATLQAGCGIVSSWTMNFVNASITQQGLLYISWGGHDGSTRNGGIIKTIDGFDTINLYKTIATNLDENTSYVQASNWLSSIVFWIPINDDSKGRVYKSTDGGSNFSQLTAIATGGGNVTLAWSGEFAYAGGNNVTGEKYGYVYKQASNTTNGGQLYSSNDNVTTFSLLYDFDKVKPTLVTNPLVTTFINVATWNAADIMLLIRSDSGAFIERSHDYGATWDSEIWHSDTEFRSAHSLGRWPYNPERVYFTTNSHIYYSSDGGNTLDDKTGDWGSEIAAWGGGVNIVPLWIEP